MEDIMELEELAARLQSLEDGQANQQSMAAQGQFMDKYGMKIGNDGDLGVAILGELNRRGIDVSAADEAVQQILDQIRAEATALLDKIKGEEKQVSELADKVNTIQEGIEAASGSRPDGGVAPPSDALEQGAADGAPPPDMGGAPPPDAGAPPPDMGGGMPPPDAGSPPSPDMGGAPPPDMGGAPPPDAGAPPPPDMGGGMPPPPPPTISDERMKQIAAKVQQKAQPQAKMWKPSSSIIKGVSGGLF